MEKQGSNNLEKPPFTLDQAVAQVHEIAKQYQSVLFVCNHARERARKRKASSRQIFDVLRNGKGIDGPNLDKYGNWRIKMKYYTCGRAVQVVVVLKENSLIVVTVI
jgi:hypothetical protein